MSVTITNRSQWSNLYHESQDELDIAGVSAQFPFNGRPAYDIQLVVGQTVLGPYTQRHVLLDSNSHGLFTIEPRSLPLSRRTTIAVVGGVEAFLR